MKTSGFIFLAGLWLLLSVFAGFGQIPLAYQAGVSLLLIALVGIPHGAIDHIIFLEGRPPQALRFYGFYFGLMALYVGLWLLWPLWGLVFFLLLSAYHFGQSQFPALWHERPWLARSLHAAWGLSILSGMIYYNLEEALAIAALSPDLAALGAAFDGAVYRWLLPLSTGLSLALLLLAHRQKALGTQRLLMEIYVLALIHFSFLVLPLVMGFTLYFVTLHAFEVLSAEFSYLRWRRRGLSLRQFVGLLFPYTAISVLGTAALAFAAQWGWLDISVTLLLFVLISILTLPHSIVMDDFYGKWRRLRA